MEWNEKNFPYFHTFSILAHLKTVYILSGVNKAAFGQTRNVASPRREPDP